MGFGQKGTFQLMADSLHSRDVQIAFKAKQAGTLARYQAGQSHRMIMSPPVRGVQRGTGR